MRKAVKKTGKIVKAYRLGYGSQMEKKLIIEGAITKKADGTYELFSQEAVNGNGQVAKPGDYFKVDEKDGRHFPYPNEKKWFEEHHRHIKDDEYEQIPQPVEFYQLGDDISPEIQELIASGALKIDATNPDKTFYARLWGADLSAPEDGTVIIYGLKEDGSVDFGLVQAEEFKQNYIEI